PAYQEVAKKYKSDKGAEAKLIEKVKNGGAGVWGQIPMPPKGGRDTIKDDEIKSMVEWVLSL
ncbi:MAG: c-type cytochrome, partial [Burkholderiales bacterium]